MGPAFRQPDQNPGALAGIAVIIHQVMRNGRHIRFQDGVRVPADQRDILRNAPAMVGQPTGYGNRRQGVRYNQGGRRRRLPEMPFQHPADAGGGAVMADNLHARPRMAGSGSQGDPLFRKQISGIASFRRQINQSAMSQPQQGHGGMAADGRVIHVQLRQIHPGIA